MQIVSPEIIVPQAVATEIKAYGQTDVTAMALAATSWLVVIATPPVPPIIQSWDWRNTAFGSRFLKLS